MSESSRHQDGLPHRRAATARIAKGTLRMFEAALDSADPAVVWLARRELADLLEACEWAAADLPEAREAS